MANPTPSRGPTNLLDYIPDLDVISTAAWRDNAALMVFKLLKNLQQAASLYPLLDPKTSGRFIADWPFEENYLARSTMDTYPGGQGVVNVAVRKNVNKLLYTYLIKLLTPHCPKIDKALNVLEYDDDASLLHVRNTHGDIVEWMTLVPLLIAKLKQKTYKGAHVHNKSLEGHIQGFKGPKDASDLAITTIIAWLDNTDTLWSMLKAYPECLATEGQRWSELLQQIKNWSTNDHNKFPADIFINDMREKAKSPGVKPLSSLISSFSEWIETEILERQSSKPAKVISVNATATVGCANHGPYAKHTTAECRGLGKRPADQQDQRVNTKNGRWMNTQQLNRGRNFNSVRFNQDKTAPGQSSSQKPKPSNGASAAGQATAAQASNNAALTASLPFAFDVTIDEYPDFDYQQEEEEPFPKSTQCCEGQLMLDQEDRIMNRVIRVAEHVSELEELGAAQLSTDNRLPPIEYYSRYEESLTRISNALKGYTEFDAEVTTDIFENDIAQTDNIFNSSPQATSRTTASAECKRATSSETTAPTPANASTRTASTANHGSRRQTLTQSRLAQISARSHPHTPPPPAGTLRSPLATARYLTK